MLDAPWKSAVISDCGLYRYSLFRGWDDDLPAVAFVMLNPSTADGLKDDPTIRRCIGFARAWGFGRLEVFNLFALRATSPKDMKASKHPVGPSNDDVLAGLLDRKFGKIVAAWGAHGSHLGRSTAVRKMIPGMWALRLTGDGEPGHPLYVPSDAKPFQL